MLARMVSDPALGPDETLLDAFAALLADTRLDPAFKALALTPPSIEDIFREVRANSAPPDPAHIQATVARYETALAGHLGDDLRNTFDALQVTGPYSPDATAAGKRSLRGRLLSLITRLEPDAATAGGLFDAADNMTDSMLALSLLVRADKGDEALATFHDRWKTDPLVLDKWFSVQAANLPADRAVDHVNTLTKHADFE